jgi:predicted PurR-regulated permease PerM
MSDSDPGAQGLDGSQVRKFVFLLLFLGLFLVVARLFYPFMTVILWSGLIYAILSGVYDRAAHRRDGSERGAFARTVLPGAFALCAVILFVLPALLLAWAVLKQVGELARGILDALNKNPRLLDLSPASAAGGFIYSITGGEVDLSGVRLLDEVRRFLASRSSGIIGFSGTLIRDAASIVVNLAFMVFTLYFFFADGKYLMRTFIGAIPIERAYTTIFIRKFKEAGKQLLLGNFLVGLFQGTMMLIIGLAFGVKGYLVFAALTVIASFIPMVGTSLVWIPLTAGFALRGEIGKAALFFVMSGVCVALLDNFLRPIILHERLKIHPLLIFFSILGGISLFGFNGLVLGPLLLILFFSALELYEGIDGADVNRPHRRRREDMEEDERTEGRRAGPPEKRP